MLSLVKISYVNYVIVSKLRGVFYNEPSPNPLPIVTGSSPASATPGRAYFRNLL
jgi:hypothetical protein